MTGFAQTEKEGKNETLYIILGTSAILNDNKYNRGKCFEKFVFEINSQIWKKDSTPFNVAGDIEIAGKQVQIKFDGAELTNEKILAQIA